MSHLNLPNLAVYRFFHVEVSSHLLRLLRARCPFIAELRYIIQYLALAVLRGQNRL